MSNYADRELLQGTLYSGGQAYPWRAYWGAAEEQTGWWPAIDLQVNQEWSWGWLSLVHDESEDDDGNEDGMWSINFEWQSRGMTADPEDVLVLAKAMTAAVELCEQLNSGERLLITTADDTRES